MPHAISLTIHRSADTIGGNCIELADASGRRILLDVGRPLDAPDDADDKTLIPKSLDQNSPCDGVLISHSHPDHHGLLNAIPTNWPVYCGEATEQLMRISFARARKPAPAHKFNHWQSGAAFNIGPFRVTPMLTDHSAADSYMLLIEVRGRRILYSGDFRKHGRKGGLVDGLMKNPPPNLDALIMEGTNFLSGKPTISEVSLQRRFVALFRQTKGRVFVSASSQNFDRLVTLYKACRQTGRTLVVDLYTAEILENLKGLRMFKHMPRAGFSDFKVVVTANYSRTRGALVEELIKKHAVFSAAALAKSKGKWVILCRASMIPGFEKKSVIPDADDAWCWSMWMGYLNDAGNDSARRFSEWFERRDCPARHLHTSGHAAESDLRAFAAAMNARQVIPVHGDKWDKIDLPSLRRVGNGETIGI